MMQLAFQCLQIFAAFTLYSLSFLTFGKLLNKDKDIFQEKVHFCAKDKPAFRHSDLMSNSALSAFFLINIILTLKTQHRLEKKPITVDCIELFGGGSNDLQQEKEDLDDVDVDGERGKHILLRTD